MFNSINSYKSLFLFLKADFSGPENFHFTPKSSTNPFDNPDLKQNIDKQLVTPNNHINTPEHKELTRSWVNSIWYELEQLWVWKIFYQNKAFSDALSTFFIQNDIDSKPWDILKLDLKDWKYILSWKASWKDWIYDITLAIPEDRKLVDAKYLENQNIVHQECKNWLAECRADNNKLEKNDTWWWSIDISKLSWAVRSHIINPENVQIAMNFFIDKWFTKEQTAWLLANMCQESSFDANPKWNKNHFWMFQWSKIRASEISNGAWVNILSRNAPILDQLKWLYWEITENSWHWNCPWTIEALKSANTPEEAAIAFLEKFERPWWLRKERPLRASFAKSFYQAMS